MLWSHERTRRWTVFGASGFARFVSNDKFNGPTKFIWFVETFLIVFSAYGLAYVVPQVRVLKVSCAQIIITIFFTSLCYSWSSYHAEFNALLPPTMQLLVKNRKQLLKNSQHAFLVFNRVLLTGSLEHWRLISHQWWVQPELEEEATCRKRAKEGA